MIYYDVLFFDLQFLLSHCRKLKIPAIFMAMMSFGTMSQKEWSLMGPHSFWRSELNRQTLMCKYPMLENPID